MILWIQKILSIFSWLKNPSGFLNNKAKQNETHKNEIKKAKIIKKTKMKLTKIKTKNSNN